MVLPAFYDSGTVSVTNGSTAVVGVNTDFITNIRPGDQLSINVEGTFWEIATVTDATNLVLTTNYGGPTATNVAYRIDRTFAGNRVAEQTERFLSSLRVFDAYGRGLFQQYSSNITEENPGQGFLRFNNTDLTLATEIYINDFDRRGQGIAELIEIIETGSTFLVRSVATTSFVAFTTSSVVSDETGYRKISIAFVSNEGSLTNGEEITFSLFGGVGDPGSDGAAATIDVGTVTTGNPGTNVIINNSGSTSAATFDFTIPRGDVGPANTTVNVSTTTTGAPGTNASVADGNPDPNIIDLEFTIPRGDVGADGTAATVVAGSTVTGVPGTNAFVTNIGTSSAAIFDFTIPRGDAGVDGAAATLDVGTVATGNPGTNVIITNSGSTSAAIFDITIPRGDVGPANTTVNVSTTTTGAPGTNASVTDGNPDPNIIDLEFTIPRGADGTDGASASVTAGTTTTGAPGTNASVVNSGTSSAAILDFTIPRGNAGTNGTDGVDGVDGTISGTQQVETANYTVIPGDRGKTLIANSASAVSFSFNASSTLTSTFLVIVKNEGDGTLTLSPDGSETIDGEMSLDLSNGQSRFIYSDGTNLRTALAGGGAQGPTTPTEDPRLIALVFRGPRR